MSLTKQVNDQQKGFIRTLTLLENDMKTLLNNPAANNTIINNADTNKKRFNKITLAIAFTSLMSVSAFSTAASKVNEARFANPAITQSAEEIESQ